MHANGLKRFGSRMLSRHSLGAAATRATRSASSGLLQEVEPRQFHERCAETDALHPIAIARWQFRSLAQCSANPQRTGPQRDSSAYQGTVCVETKPSVGTVKLGEDTPRSRIFHQHVRCRGGPTPCPIRKPRLRKRKSLVFCRYQIGRPCRIRISIYRQQPITGG